jgi:hypothetical protein
VRWAWILAVAACHHGAAEPPAPTCTAAAEHVRELFGPATERSIRIRDVFATRCDADAWSAEVRECVVATTSLRSPRHCKAKLTLEQRSALNRELAAVEATASLMPAACHEYRTLIGRLGDCRAIPPATRAALEQGYRDLARTWTRGAALDARAFEAGSIAVKCRAMADGMRQAIASTCGW